jgi:predicted Zn-dependent protease
VRVWADVGVRALPRWKEEPTDQLDYADQLLQPMFGVKLTVDNVAEWDHAGTDPHAALIDLAKADAGSDATWVIGYITPGDTATKALEELGAGAPLGHHVVVRGWAEKPETDALGATLPELEPNQRAEVIAANRRHKQTVVLLHELAATLGAISETDPTWIQNATYSPKQHTFSEKNRELMELAGDERLDASTDQVVAKKLLEVIDQGEWGGWIASDREAVLAQLRNIVDQGKAGKTAADIPPAALDQWKRIEDLRKRDPKEALIELDNLITAYPANATMHELRCEVMLDAPGVKDKATRLACARVSELAPGDPKPYLAIAEALLRDKDVAGAHAQLLLAEDRIVNVKEGADEVWRKVLGLYAQIGSLTWTEDAAAKAKLDKDPTPATVAQTRARYGVPRGATFVTPEGEAELVAAVRKALDLVYAQKFGDADKAIAAGEKKWHGAPGFEAVRCDLEMRTSRFDAARAACARALATDPHESWALYLSGVIDLREPGTTKRGIASLEKAIAADPDLGQAWRTLGKAYARGKDQAAFDELAKAYQAKFNQVLPP